MTVFAATLSVFGMVLLPIAYITFLLMMNSKSLLGDNMPRGTQRIVWNVLMGIAAATATFASLFVINKKAGAKGFIGIGLLLGLALIVHFARRKESTSSNE